MTSFLWFVITQEIGEWMESGKWKKNISIYVVGKEVNVENCSKIGKGH